MTFTERGFRNFVEFTDLYGHRVRARESSNATRNAVWVFIDGDHGQLNGAAHLDADMALRLIAALAEWLDRSGATQLAPDALD